jgi:hypothetical protein
MMILQDIELHNSDMLFDVFFDFDNQIFTAKSATEEIKFRLTKPENEIAQLHRDEILTYSIASYSKEDSVGLGDIFLHGKYI